MPAVYIQYNNSTIFLVISILLTWPILSFWPDVLLESAVLLDWSCI